MRAAYAVLREAIALIGRSALSVLFAQSGGKTRVAALISRRFSSAARVRIEASQSQRTTIRTKAPVSAAALNVPRPIHLAMVSAVPLTTDERYGPCVRFATVIVPYGHEKADMLGKIQAFATANSPLSEIASSQRTRCWREMASNSSSLSGSAPLRAGGAVRGNHMARPRGVSPWRDQ